MKSHFSRLLPLVLLSTTHFASAAVPDPAIEKQVQEILNKMTLMEEFQLLGGTGMDSVPIPRLGIPALRMTDGPSGVRTDFVTDPTTAFPTGVVMAATWDPALIAIAASGIAKEAKLHHKNMLLGPCLNIHRAPQGGRNFESFSEDPYLAAQMARAYVTGAQGEGVITSTKHFAINNQETDRMTIDVKVGERAMQEIYFPAFRAAIDAGTWSIMAAYNKVNGEFASENGLLLNDILKRDWGFRGFVVSDWGATHSTVPALKGGLDIEMPWGYFLSVKNLLSAFNDGAFSRNLIDEKARRILRAIYSSGILIDKPAPVDPAAIIAENRQVARKVALEGIVLLKNDAKTLPLNRAVLHHVAIIGPNAVDTPYSGGGSSRVFTWERLDALKALQADLGSGINIHYASGKDLAEAESAAKAADVAIVFGGYNEKLEGEGTDRASLALPGNQNELITRVAAANPATVVVINSGGPVLMPWLKQVKSVVQAGYAGVDGMLALGDLLTGAENFSGKLTYSMFAQAEDSAAFGSFPGKDGTVAYDEGIFVGYRHLDRAGIAPLFAFGHGLSYTSFQYQNLIATGASEISVDVANTGAVRGAEIVQLYVGSTDKAPTYPRALQELKSFARLTLAPGESQRVKFSLKDEDFSSYDVATHAWRKQPGEYEIAIGASSRDIRARKTIRIP